MHTVIRDLRYGARMLVKNPGFTLIAVLTLALGIGANTAIFSLADQVLLRYLPVPHPEELVLLRSPGPSPGNVNSDLDEAASFSYPIYKDLRDQNQVFTGLLTRYAIGVSLAGGSQIERARGELVSGNYFDVLGVRPALGRVFSAQDETAPGANPVAVLSYGYWQRRFAGNPGILNQTLTVNGTPLTVVGVSSPGFAGVQVGQVPDVFIPITMKAQMMPNTSELDNRSDAFLALLGRLKPGLTLAQAQAGLQPVYRQILQAEVPLRKISQTRQAEFLAKPLLLETGSHGRQILQHDARAPLLTLMAMVGLVLLITCANLASLLIARGVARRREIAVRMALGADRWKIVRQLLAEPLLLSVAGGVVGLMLGSWALAAIVRAIPSDIGATGLNPTLDWRVLVFTFGVSLLAGLLFGLAPAFSSARVELADSLKEQTSTGNLARVRLRRALIVAQVALTTVLLIGAGLFAHSLYNLKTVDLGVRPDHVIQFSVAPELDRYSPAQTRALADRIRDTIAVMPGVQAVSAAAIPVFQNSDAGSNITVEGYTFAPNEEPHVLKNWIAARYFGTMGTPLLEGREFTEADTSQSPEVAIINESVARRFFTGRDPLQYRLVFGAGKDVHPDIQIVGVVKDSKHEDPRDPIHPFVYLPLAQLKDLGRATFYVRTAQDPGVMSDAVRKSVASIDASLPIYDLKTLTAQINESLFTDRLVAFLSVGLGLLSALLAAMGLYGVMAYTVARRIREIGIRMALGATREGVAWMVLREVVRMAALGLLIGVPVAFAVGRFAEATLYGVKAGDPPAYALAAVFLGVLALLAGSLPARRATAVDPMVALRYE